MWLRGLRLTRGIIVAGFKDKAHRAHRVNTFISPLLFSANPIPQQQQRFWSPTPTLRLPATLPQFKLIMEESPLALVVYLPYSPLPPLPLFPTEANTNTPNSRPTFTLARPRKPSPQLNPLTLPPLSLQPQILTLWQRPHSQLPQS